MNAAAIIREARERAGLSKRELARRAHTSPAAIVLYESGAREPSYESIKRVVAAAGFDVQLRVVPARGPDPAVSARRLLQVLDLAANLPQRPASRHIAFPPFGQ